MARYIKANPKVAKFLNLESDRNTVKDGNYLLWQSDMLAFGPLTQLADTLAQIGGIALLAHEAREEQDGTVTRPLPQATDERFVMPPTPEEEAAAEETTDTAKEETAESVSGEDADTDAESGESESKDESETAKEE